MFILGIQTDGPVRTRVEIAEFLLAIAQGLVVTSSDSGSAVDNQTGKQFATFSYDPDSNPNVMAVQFEEAKRVPTC